MCKSSSETPLFICFGTKPYVHPVRTKSLSEKPLHNFEIIGKRYVAILLNGETENWRAELYYCVGYSFALLDKITQVATND